MTFRIPSSFKLALLACSIALAMHGQDNYEIQVYGSDTIPPGRTMVELHSNFTVEGFKTSVGGVLPDEHQLHETVEITQGWNNWFETGFYIFTSAGPNRDISGLGIISGRVCAFRTAGIGL